MDPRIEWSLEDESPERVSGFGLWFREHPKAYLEGFFGSATAVADVITCERGFEEAWAIGVCIKEAALKTAWIDELRVPEALRSRGMGSALVAEAVVALSRELGVRSFWLVAAPISEKWRRPLYRFYRRFGFKVAPERCTGDRGDYFNLTIPKPR